MRKYEKMYDLRHTMYDVKYSSNMLVFFKQSGPFERTAPNDYIGRLNRALWLRFAAVFRALRGSTKPPVIGARGLPMRVREGADVRIG